MKKILVLLLVVVLALSVAACGGSKADEAKGTEVKGEGVMTYAEYAAAELDSAVVIETYVQDKQSWWNDQATLYTQDREGAYFIYNCACSQADYDKLVPGQKIKVTGTKSEWSGEIEIVDATLEIEDGNYIAPVTNITTYLASDNLIEHQNKFVTAKGMTVVPIGQNDDGSDAAFFYGWDGSGQEGSDSDLYFKASRDDITYTFVVEYYLRNEETDVYKAVQNLQIGDKIDIEGFLYWYEGMQPHVTSVTPAK